MANLLIIGAGGVGNVVAYKCAQAALEENAFASITLASRTEEKCRKITQNVKSRLGYEIAAAQVDADDVPALCALLRKLEINIVCNVALPYQDLHIMDACLACGCDYVDTANYEPPETAHFEYSWQWAYMDRFKAAGLTALLGSGFDPGATNVFAAWIVRHEVEAPRVLDIIDCNAGSHGQPFATNFNPEINIREVTAPGRYWEHGQWVTTDPLAWRMAFDFPDGIGKKPCYLMYHEELESLAINLPGLERARFWMTFSREYLNYLNVLENVGLTSIKPVSYKGMEIVPLKFLASLLPDPASLGPLTRGRTCIGDRISGFSNGAPKTVYLYNICSHEKCHEETGSQAISYTTGVPAMIGTKLVAQNIWKKPGVWNLEQLDPDPFMADMNKYGLPWHCMTLEERKRAWS